jgi:hypothetical protein
MAFQDQRCHRTGQPLSVSCSIGEHLFAEMEGAQLDSGGDRWSQWRLVTSNRNGVTSRLQELPLTQDLTVQSLRRCRCAAD